MNNTELSRRLLEWSSNRRRYMGGPDDGFDLLRLAAHRLTDRSSAADSGLINSLRTAVDEANRLSSSAYRYPETDADVICQAINVARRYSYSRQVLHDIGAQLGISAAMKKKGWSHVLREAVAALVPKPAEPFLKVLRDPDSSLNQCNAALDGLERVGGWSEEVKAARLAVQAGGLAGFGADLLVRLIRAYFP